MAVRTLTKLLAGVQDLLFGRGTVSQNRNGTDYTINRIQLIAPVDLLADLKALQTTDPNAQYFEAIMKGGAAINDGAGGSYYFDATSTATPNDTTVIKPDDVTLPNPGRWLKQLAEGVDRTGDVMTGQLKGITPVSAADFTRKDYVDARFNAHLAGLTNAGVHVTYTSDLNTIVVNSRHYADAAVVTNEPTEFGGAGFFIVETIVGAADTERLQIVTGITGDLAMQRFVRSYTSSTWSAWRPVHDVYDNNGDPLMVHTTATDAVNYIQAINAATGNQPGFHQLGPDDVGLYIEGISLHNGDIVAADINCNNINGSDGENLDITAGGTRLVALHGGDTAAYNGAVVMLENPVHIQANSNSVNTWNTNTVSYVGAKAAIIKVYSRTTDLSADGADQTYTYLRKYGSGLGNGIQTLVSANVSSDVGSGLITTTSSGVSIVSLDASRRYQWYHTVGNGIPNFEAYIIGYLL